MYETLVIIGDIIVAISVLPQITKVIVSKKSDDLSQYMMFSWIFGNGFLLAYNILVIKDFWLILLFSWNLFVALVLLVLYFVFRSGKHA